MTTNRWTKEQVKLAFHLYCQLPYGRIDGRNPEIIALSVIIGRTVDTVAMKMLNIASFDPAITSTGRVGLGNASALDKNVWDELPANWGRLALKCNEQLQSSAPKLEPVKWGPSTLRLISRLKITQEGSSKCMCNNVSSKKKIRRAVLSSYRGRCCMSGVSESRLLVASHILPWSKDATRRLNPSNGFCLSAIHDRAFDQGLITLAALEGRTIELPERFAPKPSFAVWNGRELFLDNRK